LIDSKDISVVVQGAIDKVNTPLCLRGIRKILPKAEIILSTWEGSNTDRMDYDILVLSKDVGGQKDAKTNFVNNTNRQIVSTVNGLKKADRKYVMKVRSDLIFRNAGFLKYFDRFQQRDEDYKIFTRKIVFSSYFSKKYLGEINYVVHPTPFHLSDWFQFGLLEDILKLYDIPLIESEPNFSNYLLKHKLPQNKFNMFGASHQYAPEQYIFMQCILKTAISPKMPEMRNIMDYTDENIKFSEIVVINNSIILDPDQINFYCGKNGIDPYRNWSITSLLLPRYVYEGLYSHYAFCRDYINYLDINYKVPINIRLWRLVYQRLQSSFGKKIINIMVNIFNTKYLKEVMK
jgi:hypothetical protein